MVEAEKRELQHQGLAIVGRDGLLPIRVDTSERKGVGFFWRQFEREARKLWDQGDPGPVSPESLNRDLWTTYYDLFQGSRCSDWVNEIRKQWQQNLSPPHGHLVDILESKAGNYSLSAFLPASINVAIGPYATYALMINGDFGEKGVLSRDNLVALDIVPFPVADSARPGFAQPSSAVLRGEIARLALSPPFVFNLQNLEGIDKRKLQKTIAGLLGLMIEVGWADRKIGRLVLKGTLRRFRDFEGGSRFENQSMAECIDTGGKPLYAGSLRTEGEIHSGSLREAILRSGYPFSSTVTNWPEDLKNPSLSVLYGGKERTFEVDGIGSASDFHQFVSLLHSGAILDCLDKGGSRILAFIAAQQGMVIPDELASLQIAAVLSTGLKINSWRTNSS